MKQLSIEFDKDAMLATLDHLPGKMLEELRSRAPLRTVAAQELTGLPQAL